MLLATYPGPLRKQGKTLAGMQSPGENLIDRSEERAWVLTNCNSASFARSCGRMCATALEQWPGNGVRCGAD